MRKIKFRAWDKNKKKWVKPEDLMDDNVMSVDLTEEGFKFKNAGFIFCQYTGFINSSRNQDVYEGDIVRVTEFDFENGCVADLHGKIGVVDFFNGSYCITIGRCIYDLNRFSFPMMIERLLVDIIGNIYENPELMK
jgi:uncharacterized phage protein (TIGR01671 family)